jgi:hypothetical protein
MDSELDGNGQRISMPRSSLSVLKHKNEQLLDSARFDHFLALTDNTGMLQHSKFSAPDRRFGYTTDDNARALVLSTRQFNFELDKRWLTLSGRFLAFLIGMQRSDGRFHNFMSYNRKVENDFDSGDHLGRALWVITVIVVCLHQVSR